jgi:hypothetical protein
LGEATSAAAPPGILLSEDREKPPRRGAALVGEYRMKKMLVAGLVAAAQVLPASHPAAAAELHEDRAATPAQVSAFAGARLRVPLGGGREKPQAGLAVTSTLRSGTTGELRFARGAELGFSGRDPRLGLSLAGRPLTQLAAGRTGPDGRKQGFSTAGWIAIGASAVIIVGGVLIFDYIGDQSE